MGIDIKIDIKYHAKHNNNLNLWVTKVLNKELLSLAPTRNKNRCTKWLKACMIT